MNTGIFLNHVISNSKGINLPRISQEDILELFCPLPPLAEQQRIVDRIERLFEKLDQAKELIQKALDSYENRKAAILHKAFTGELTLKWREENEVGLTTRVMKPLSDFCSSFQYGTSKKSKPFGKVAVIRMGNLQDGEINWDNMAYSDDQDDVDKYLLKKGDVLFNRTNSPELVGKTSIYNGEYPAIFAGYLIRLNYHDTVDGRYLNYMLNSPAAKEYCNRIKTDAVNQSNINAKKIAEFKIPLYPLSEQIEIVKILQNFFDKECKATKIFNMIEQINLVKKSILARAFLGEMDTNDPLEMRAVFTNAY